MRKSHAVRRGNCRSIKAGLTLAAAAASLALTQSASAVTGTWLDTDSNSNWSDGNNWSTAPTPPGTDVAGVTTNGDTADFNNSSTGDDVNLDVGNWNIANILFDTASANGFIIGNTAGNSLLLSSGGEILETSTVAGATSEAVDAPMVLEGNYTFENDSSGATSGLKLAGNISVGGTTPATLTLQGSAFVSTGTSSDTITGVLVNGSSTASLSIVKTGAGSWNLGSTGISTFTGPTTVNGGYLSVTTIGGISPYTDVTVNNSGSEFESSTVSSAPGTSPTVHSVTVNSFTTFGQSNSTCDINVANNSGGPAVLVNDQNVTAAATPVAANLDLTGTGGITALINETYGNHLSFSKNLDLGTTSHLFYVNEGNTNISSTDLQINELVSGDGPNAGIIKSGSGAIKFEDAATEVLTFTGPIEIQEGSIKAVGGGTSNQFSGVNTLTIDGGNFNLDGNGSAGDATFGAVTGTNGSISGNNNNTLYAPSFNFNIGAGYSFTVQGSLGDYSGGAVIPGDGNNSGVTSAVVINGPGSVTFQGIINSYTAGTTINGGTLLCNMNASGNPISTGAVALNGSTLNLDPSATAGMGAAISYSLSNLAVSTQFSYGGGDVLGVKQGNENSFTVTIGNSGATGSVLNRVNNGTLVIAPDAGTASLGLPGGTEFIFVKGAMPTVTNGIVNTSIVGENTDSNGSADFLTYTSVDGFAKAAYSSSTDITTAGANAVYLAQSGSNNTVTGASTIYALNTNTQTITTNGTLTVGDSTSGHQAGVILNGGSITGTGTLAFGGAEGTIYTSNANSSVSANITGTGGATFFGPGTINLTGNDSGLTGGFNLNQGTIDITADNNIGAASNPITFGGGTLQFSSTYGTAISTHPITINAGNGTIDTQTNTITISSSISGVGNLTKVGTGTLVLAGANSYANTTITNGVLQLGTGGTLGSGSVANNSALVFGGSSSVAVAGSISGSGTVTQSGSGITTLTASNSYSGQTAVSAGTLQVSNANALGFGGQITGSSVPVATVSSTGTLDLDGQTVNKPITLDGGTLINSNTSTAAGLSSAVAGYDVTSAGSGVAADLTTVSGGGGTGAAVKLLLGLTNKSVTTVTPGTNYTTAPTVTVTGGGGTGATAVATLSGSGVGSITITNPGIGYTGTPSFSLSGGGGSGASVTANDFNFTAVGAQATAPGSGYTSVPTVTPTAIDSSAGTLTEVLPTVSAVLNTLSVQANSSIAGAGPVVLNTAVNGAASSGTVTLDLDGTSSSDAINSVIGNGTSGGTLALSKTNSSTWTLTGANTYTGGTSASAGKLVIDRVSSTTSALPNGPLAISGTGDVQLAQNLSVGSNTGPTPASNVNITSLSITGSGDLDIANNHIIIDYTPGNDPISSIAAMVASGYNSDHWNGPGIISTNAQSNAGSYGIGYADSADVGNPAGLASNQIEIAYTLLGDANLDGKVNGSDFTLMAANFNDSVTAGWDKGDFNYSNTVNGDDFVLLADNFNQFASQSAVASADLAALDSFAASNGIDINLTSVPEPATAAILLTGMGILGIRRRRKAR